MKSVTRGVLSALDEEAEVGSGEEAIAGLVEENDIDGEEAAEFDWHTAVPE